MRYLTMMAVLATLAGCATAAPGTAERAHYDRKYNTWHPQQAAAAEGESAGTGASYDRKYNFYRPVERRSGSGS